MAEEKGLKWIKPVMEPGDLILWDSQTPHYNLPPTGTSSRFCTYVAMAPAAELKQEELNTKKATFDAGHGTSHWQQGLQVINPALYL